MSLLLVERKMLDTLIEDWCFTQGSNEATQVAVQWKVLLSFLIFFWISAVRLPCALRRKVQSGFSYGVSASSGSIAVVLLLSHRCCCKFHFICELHILHVPTGTVALNFLAYFSDVNYLIFSRLSPYRNSRWICNTMRSSACTAFSWRSFSFVHMLLCFLFRSSMI